VSGRTAVVVFLALVTLVIALAGFTVYRVVQVAPAVVADLAARIPTPTPSPTPTPRPPALSGVVTAEGGKPVSGVTVRAYQGSALVAASITDANGRYGLNLSAGAYRIGFVPGDASLATQYWQNAATLLRANEITVTASPATLNVTLRPTFELSGRVSTAADDRTLADVAVYAYLGGTSTCCVPVASVQTAADGSYRLHLATGLYRLLYVPRADSGVAPRWSGDATSWASAPDVSVSGGRGLGALARLPAPGYSLAGTIKKSQSTLPVSVFFYRGGDAPCCDLVAAVTDNSLGLYALSLAPGTYRVSFVAQTVGLRSVWWKDAASFAVADDLSVQGATSGIDAVIR